MTRQLLRIAIVAFAAMLIVGLACLFVSHMDPTPARGLRAYHRRSLEPRPDRLINQAMQVVFMVAGAFAARKLLRLHL